jgi:hypothetical protein
MWSMQITSTDRQVLKKIDQDQIEADFLASVAHFVDSVSFCFKPQARLRHRLGLALSPPASQAGWLVSSNLLPTGHRQNFARKTVDDKSVSVLPTSRCAEASTILRRDDEGENHLGIKVIAKGSQLL